MKRALLFLASAGLMVSVYGSYTLNRQLIDARAQLAKQADQIQSLESTLKARDQKLANEKNRNESEISVELQAIRDLKAQLEDQGAKTDAAKQRLLDARSNSRPTNDVATLRDNLRQEKAYLDDLDRQIKGLHQKESQVGTQAGVAQNQEKFQQKVDSDQLDAQIQTQENVIKDTLQKMSEFRGRRDYIGVQQYQDYQTQLKSERAALQQLKDQKKSVNQQWQAQRSLTADDSKTQQSGLKQSEAQMRQTYQQETARYQAMQKQLDSLTHDHQSTQQNLKQLEADFQAQQAKTRDLQTRLQEENGKLQKLSQ